MLRVEVVKFRLRSSAAVFSGGIMTGGDVLDVKVEVRDGDRIVRQFVTGAGMVGTGFSVSQSKRFEKVIRRAAERVAEEL